MYLLDTNVLSQTTKENPHPGVMSWWVERDAADLWLSAIVIQELRYGIERLDPGRRRDSLALWLEDGVLHDFSTRILPVDERIADMSGRMLAQAKREGKAAQVPDALIAATAKLHGFAVVTLNRNHFEPLGVELVEF